MENVTITSYVDNVRFVGARSGVIAAVLEFIKRCKSVGATCDNEPMDETSVIQLSETQGDFLGVSFDYETWTHKCTTKTLEKVKMLGLVPTMPLKALAAVMGLCNFAARILQFPFSRTFHLRRRYGMEARIEALLPSSGGWGNQMVELTEGEFAQLKQMVAFILENKPVPSRVRPEASTFLFTDACAEGWGGVLVDSGLHILQIVSGKWTTNRFESSVSSEPQGVIEVLKALKGTLLGLGSPEIAIIVDHAPLVFAWESQHPHAYTYNECLAFLDEEGWLDRVSFRFICGVDNPADFPSRGRPIPDHFVLRVPQKVGREKVRFMR